MKETIKKWIIFWVTSFLTLVLLGFAYATVSTVTTWETLTADMWNSMAWNYDYSLNEVDTWKKWVDGKPIYRKVVTLSSNPIADNTWRTINYDNPPVNPETLISSSYKWNKNNDNYSVDTAWKKLYIFNLADLAYILWTSTPLSFSQWDYVILEYTKTTD